MRATLGALAECAERGGAYRKGLEVLARHMDSAIGAYSDAVEAMLGLAGAPRAAFLGSVPYLMLSGIVLAGWQMARAAILCAEKLRQADGAAGHGADPFYAHKLTTCILYGSQVLPRARAYLSSIQDGADVAQYANRI